MPENKVNPAAIPLPPIGSGDPSQPPPSYNPYNQNAPGGGYWQPPSHAGGMTSGTHTVTTQPNVFVLSQPAVSFCHYCVTALNE